MNWIKCSDRLPPSAGYNDSKVYLILADHTMLAYWMDDEWVSHSIAPYETHKPTHWMPLPNPPEEKP